MMKKCVTGLISLFLSLTPVLADGRYEIEIKEGEGQAMTINVGELYELQLVMSPQDANRKVHVEVWLENRSSTESMIIFNEEYSERALHKAHIRYDKMFGGDKGTRITSFPSPRAKSARTYFFIHPGENGSIVTTDELADGESVECVIPIYFARKKGFLFKQWQLLQKREEKLSIKVRLLPDTAFLELAAGVDKLLEKAAHDTIWVCKHSGVKPHYPPEDFQLNRWKYKVDSLNKDLKNEFERRNVTSGTVVYNDFAQLKNKLNKIDISAIPIIEHKLPNECGCPAKYRRMSPKDIYNTLVDRYQALYAGSVSKESIMGEVQALKKHSEHLKNKKDYQKYKKGIDRYYNQIVNH